MSAPCLSLFVLLLMWGGWLGAEAAICQDPRCRYKCRWVYGASGYVYECGDVCEDIDCGDGTGTSPQGLFVLLTPSGELEMTASWPDSPREGVTYDVYILTNYRDPPSSAVHVKKLLTFDDGLTQMSYKISAANKDEFTPIGATVGNFPGFELGQMYRLWIEHFDADRVLLGTGLAGMSHFATPMIQASAPRDLTECGWLSTHSPCDTSTMPYDLHSFRVHWNGPLSRGYGSYVPPDSYQIEYYKLQISDTSAFEQIRAEDRCNTGQADDFTVMDYNDFCNFDQRVAVFQNVKRYWSSMPVNQDIYVRVAAGTVIGDGDWSAPLAVRPTNIWFAMWQRPFRELFNTLDEFVMQKCALIPHARWEPWAPHVPGTQKPPATHCGCEPGYTEKWSWDEGAKTLWRSLHRDDIDYAVHAPKMHCLPCG